MSELKNKIILFIETFKKDFNDIVHEIDKNRLSNDTKQKILDKKENELNIRENELNIRENDMERFKKVSFISSLSKQITNKDNKIKILEKQLLRIKKKYTTLEKDNKSLSKTIETQSNLSIGSENESNNESSSSTINNESKSEIVNNDDLEIDEQLEKDFEEFEVDIDENTYLFSQNNKGEGIFFKKLKNGKYSKKISGTYTEDSDGELDIEWN